MHKLAHKYRIYPSKSQKEILNQIFGSCRFIYNSALDHKNSTYKNLNKSLSYNYLATHYLKSLKQELDWLKDPPSQALQCSLRNLDRAFVNFFEGRTKFPKFKKKYNNRQSFTIPQGCKVDYKDNTISLPKIGKVIAVLHRKIDSKYQIKSCTISKENNKYYISISLHCDDALPSANADGKAIGIDLGLTHFLITSDNEKIDNPKFYNQYAKRLKELQRRLSHKKKGSNNYSKLRTKIAKIHNKICNKRNDFQHKLSSKIVNENQVIILEDLNVKQLLQTSYRNISRSIGDVAWGGFANQIIYKSNLKGKLWYQIDRFEPSSKRCFVCKHENEDLELSDRYWECPHCGTFHDRDINSAYNIKEIGLRDLSFEFGQELPELKSLEMLLQSILQEQELIGGEERKLTALCRE